VPGLHGSLLLLLLLLLLPALVRSHSCKVGSPP
jgi:hypothetical protein